MNGTVILSVRKNYGHKVLILMTGIDHAAKPRDADLAYRIAGSMLSCMELSGRSGVASEQV